MNGKCGHLYGDCDFYARNDVDRFYGFLMVYGFAKVK